MRVVVWLLILGRVAHAQVTATFAPIPAPAPVAVPGPPVVGPLAAAQAAAVLARAPAFPVAPVTTPLVAGPPPPHLAAPVAPRQPVLPGPPAAAAAKSQAELAKEGLAAADAYAAKRAGGESGGAGDAWSPVLERETSLHALSPAAPPFETRGPTRLYRVALADWDAFHAAATAHDHGEHARIPGTLLRETRNGWVSPPGRGHYIADIGDGTHRRLAWLAVTQLEITAHRDGATVIVDLTDRDTKAPLGGVTVAFAGKTAITDAHGHAALPAAADAALVTATRGDDSVLMELPDPYEVPDAAQLGWYVTPGTTRYQPGDTAHVRGWIRRVDKRPLQAGDVTRIAYRLETEGGGVIAAGTSPLGGDDSFAIDVPLPPEESEVVLVLATEGNIVEHRFAALSVGLPADSLADGPLGTVTASATRVVGGGTVDFTIAAAYRGGPVWTGDVKWEWRDDVLPDLFAPAAWRGFQFFGRGVPFPSGSQVAHLDRAGRASLRATVTARGTARRLDVGEWLVAGPGSFYGWPSATHVDVFPAALAVGLRTTPTAIEAIVTDLDGHAVAGVPIELPGTSCKLVSAAQPVSCVPTHPLDGEVTARIRDARGRIAETIVASAPASEPPLDVAVTSAPSIAAGAEAVATVRVTRRGAPVEGAHVHVAIADDEVLAAVDANEPTAADAIGGGQNLSARQQVLGVQSSSTQTFREFTDRHVQLTVSTKYYDGDGPDGGYTSRQIRAARASLPTRHDVTSLVAFVAAPPTDATGTTTIRVAMPDAVARYRIRAEVADGDDFGRGDTVVVVTRPLELRARAPRDVREGDAFTLTAMLANTTAAPLAVRFATRAIGIRATAAAAVTLPPHGSAEIPIALTADDAGAAQVQLVAEANGRTTTIGVAIDIRGRGDHSTSGELPAGGATLPAPVAAVTLSGSRDLLLADALRALVDDASDAYDVRVGRLVALAALGGRHVPGGPTAAELVRVARADGDVARYPTRWRGSAGHSSTRTVGFLTAALVAARTLGSADPPHMLSAGIADLHRELAATETELPVKAYDLYVLARAGQPVLADVRALLAAAGGVAGLGAEPAAWLLAAVAADPGAAAERTQLLPAMRRWVIATGDSAAVASSFPADDRARFVASNVQATAIVLEALVRVAPRDPLVEKLVRGLLAMRSDGVWATTVDDAAAIAAIALVPPPAPGTARTRVWFGDRFAGEPPPEASLVAPSLGTATLVPAGAGPVYYRASVPRFATPSAHGMSLERTIEGATRGSDGAWHVARGAVLSIRVRANVPTETGPIVVTSPYAAGVATGGIDGAMSPRRSAVATSSHAHVDRLMFDTLDGGIHEWRFYARGVTPGRFAMPGAEIEVLFTGTGARTAAETLVVE